MECTTTREQLLEPVSQADRSTAKNHTLPVLSCVLLSVADSTLTVSATNLEVGVEYTVSVGKAEDGAVAVSGSVLSHVLSTLPQGAEVSLKATSGHLEITSVGGSSKIALQDVEDFPQLPRVSDGTTLTFPAKDFRAALDAVAYCASSSTIKPELASIFVHANGSTLITAATDSFRLAEKNTPLKRSVTADPFLIPARSCADLVRLLDKAVGDVECVVGTHQFSVTLPGVYFTLRLTTGTFPDYTEIIPKSFVAEVTVLAKDFDRALRKAVVFSDQFHQTTLSFSPKKKVVTIHTENQTVGETSDTIPASSTGDSVTLRFNHRYLIDSLRSIVVDSIVLQFATTTQATVVRPAGTGASFIYLVMPMNR